MRSLSRVRLFVTLWAGACQAPPSMGFSRQEYWSGLLFPPPEDIPNPGIELRSPALRADSLPSEPPGNPSFQGRAFKGRLGAGCCRMCDFLLVGQW